MKHNLQVSASSQSTLQHICKLERHGSIVTAANDLQEGMDSPVRHAGSLGQRCKQLTNEF